MSNSAILKQKLIEELNKRLPPDDTGKYVFEEAISIAVDQYMQSVLEDFFRTKIEPRLK